MKNLTDLFKLAQLTRTQPQYGYGLRLKKTELSSLAEHHYLVTFIAWQLARNVNDLGAKINIEKVLEFCLIHDLGELFGGDIGRLYAVINPAARTAAKAFEAENQKFIAQLFGIDKKHFQNLSDEIMDANTDESNIAKIADYMECAHYLKYLNQFSDEDRTALNESLPKFLSRLKDETAKKELTEFIKKWLVEIDSDKTIPQILQEYKNG